jgi:nucleoside-diphosphate-sugar epimerase
MRVLIIGGTGILSGAIAQFAANAGHEVTILTNGLGELPEPLGIKQHLIVDRNDHIAFQTAIAQTNVLMWDLVVDAICYNAYQAEALLTAIQGKSRHTIVISTAIIYDPREYGVLTTDSPLASETYLGQYGREKVKMETFWMDAWKTSLHPVTILRPPHIIGAGSLLGVIPLHNRDPFLVFRLTNQQTLLLADGGRQLIQVVFNEDIARVILAAFGKSVTFGKIYNCANPVLITGRRYFEIIANLLKVPLNVKNIPGEIIWESNWGWALTSISRILSMDSLQQDVGYVPNTPLEVALKKTLTYLLHSHSLQADPANGHLQSIDSKIAQSCEAIKLILSDYADDRVKSPVDFRMDADPSRQCNLF